MNANGNDSDEENLLDFIGRELDQREEEARREDQQQKQCLQQQNNEGNDHTNNQMERTAFALFDHVDEVDWTGTDGNEMIESPIENERQSQPHNLLEETAMEVSKTTSKRKREYSIFKSTTPRFSFHSSLKSTPTAVHKSPVERQPTSSTVLSSASKSDKPKPNKSSKRKHRHSFRQSIDRIASNSIASMTQVNNNMRELGFAPKFLANLRAGSTNDDAISSQMADGDDDVAQTKRKWNRLSSSQSAASSSPFKQSSSSRRNKAGGYLIQNLRSLRINDQRMAMRLRASKGGPISQSHHMQSSAPHSKRRRSSSGRSLQGPNQVSATELDVTVLNAALPDQKVNDSTFVAGKIRLAYIHRYTGTLNFKLPRYSWIVLPQNVIHEQCIEEGGGGRSTQLRCYNAIIIPPRVASINAEGVAIPLNGLEEHELPCPTIICANTCEQLTHESSAPHPSFDIFCR